jgi:hypothetical protein
MKRILLSFVAILALSMSSIAQLWVVENSNLPETRGITSMVSVDANIVWAAAYDGTTPTNPVQDFCKTTNGGTTWTTGTITGATGVSIANITAVDANNAWVITYYQSGSGTKDGVYHTSNGGTSWTQQTTALFSNAASFPDCIYFWDATTGWCMGDPISGDFEIYTTTNGGTTWTPVPGAQIPNPLSGEFGVVGYYSVVGNTVWFGTNEGRIYKSIDQGHNWTVSAISGWTTIYVKPFFKDQNIGYAMDLSGTTTVGNLAKTTDGGATWVPVTPTGNVFSNDMAYVPGTASTWVTTGAATGLEGVTYSFDDGASWSDMVETIGTQYLAETWQNDSTGWAGGFVQSGIGGMNKFHFLLALSSDFTASDSSILVFDSVQFQNNSIARHGAYLWTFQGGIPASSTAKNPPYITYLQAGSWNVTLRVTDSLGVVTKVKPGYIHVGGVGINELSKAKVAVYPNPVKDVMTVNATANIQEIQILNLLGQVIMTRTVNTNTITLNTSDLKQGVYNLKVKMTDGFINKKIIVN